MINFSLNKISIPKKENLDARRNIALNSFGTNKVAIPL
jgi:hypothetical protein